MKLTTADEKITAAKSIVYATMATLDAGVPEEANFDPHWPLSAAIELLEAASEQVEVQS